MRNTLLYKNPKVIFKTKILSHNIVKIVSRETILTKNMYAPFQKLRVLLKMFKINKEIVSRETISF